MLHMLCTRAHALEFNNVLHAVNSPQLETFGQDTYSSCLSPFIGLIALDI